MLGSFLWANGQLHLRPGRVDPIQFVSKVGSPQNFAVGVFSINEYESPAFDAVKIQHAENSDVSEKHLRFLIRKEIMNYGREARAKRRVQAAMPWMFDLGRAVNQAAYLAQHILYYGTPEYHQEMLQKYPTTTNPNYREWEEERFKRDVARGEDAYQWENRYPAWEEERLRQQPINMDDPNAVTPTDEAKNKVMDLQFQEEPQTLVERAQGLTNALKDFPPMNVEGDLQRAIFRALMEVHNGARDRAYDELFRAGLNDQEIQYVLTDIDRWKSDTEKYRTAATSEDTESAGQNVGFLREPKSELYPPLFRGSQTIPVEVRSKLKSHVLNVLQLEFVNPDQWIYFTIYGSGISYNWDEGGDLDLQMWVDHEKYMEQGNDDLTVDDLIAAVRRNVQQVNFPSFKDLGLESPAGAEEEADGSMLIQYYPKPGKGTPEENLSSKPYACYDLETDEWLEQPEPIEPTFYGEQFVLLLPKAEDIALQAEALIAEYERDILNWQFWFALDSQTGNPSYKDQMLESKDRAEQEKAGIKNLFDGVFQGRAKAYSPEGKGIEDERDMIQKLLEVWGIFQKLKHFAREPLPWDEQEMPDPPEKNSFIRQANFVIYSANVRELADKMLKRIMEEQYMPWMAKAEKNKKWMEEQGVYDENEIDLHYGARIRWFIPAMNELVRQAPETYKLWPWLFRAFKKQALKQGDPALVPVGHVIDILRGATMHLDKLRDNPQGGVPDVMQAFQGFDELEAWVLERNNEMAAEGEEAENRTAYEFPDGYKIVQVNPDNLNWEGEQMGHCVGTYCTSVMSGRAHIFSLRDPKGFPHATIEIKGQKPPREQMQWQGETIRGLDQPGPDALTKTDKAWEIVQIQGKENQEPNDQYKGYIKAWFQELQGNGINLTWDNNIYSPHRQDDFSILNAADLEDWYQHWDDRGGYTPKNEREAEYEEEYGLRIPDAEVDISEVSVVENIADHLMEVDSYGRPNGYVKLEAIDFYIQALQEALVEHYGSEEQAKFQLGLAVQRGYEHVDAKVQDLRDQNWDYEFQLMRDEWNMNEEEDFDDWWNNNQDDPYDDPRYEMLQDAVTDEIERPFKGAYEWLRRLQEWITPKQEAPKQPKAPKPTTSEPTKPSNNPDTLEFPGTFSHVAALQGLPQSAFGENPEVQELAQMYMENDGFGYEPPQEYVPVDPNRAKAIADEYDRMEHNPNDPNVKASYDAFKAETLQQYEHLVNNGFVMEFYPDNFDPYPKGPRQALEDIRDNKHLYVYPTDDGFGSSENEYSDHPLLEQTGLQWNGKPVTYNDVFRGVHDVFGHGKEGVGFRWDGEDNAWRQHAAMYSELAKPAMTAETRGQNSWVNFGPHGEANQTANQQETIYADQKAGILPEWVHKDSEFAVPAGGFGSFSSVQKTAEPGYPSPEHRDPGGWAGIMEKAQRLRTDGQVEVQLNAPDHVLGVVQGDHGTYQTELWRDDPNAQAITLWDCDCQWEDYSWGRTRQFKKYEGRPCSHTLALYWESMSTPLDEDAYFGEEGQVPLPQEYLPAGLPGGGQPAPQGPPQSVPAQPQPGEQLVLPGTFSSVVEPKWRLQYIPPRNYGDPRPDDSPYISWEGEERIPEPRYHYWNLWDDNSSGEPILVGSVVMMIHDQFLMEDSEYLQDSAIEPYLKIPELWIDPKYRNTNAFFELTKPVVQFLNDAGVDLQANFANERLEQLVKKWFERRSGSWYKFSMFQNGDYVRLNRAMEGYDEDGGFHTVPRNKIAEVIWSDEQETIVIVSTELGRLEAHNIRLEAPTSDFSLVPRTRGTAPRRHK